MSRKSLPMKLSVPHLQKSRMEYSGRRLRVEKRFYRTDRTQDNHVVDVLTFPMMKSVAILPITKTGKVILEKHFRYAPQSAIFEIPAGWLETNEKPAEAAKRELLEETGFKAESLVSMGSILPAPGYSTEEIFLFLAKLARNRVSQSLEKGEVIETSTISKEKLFDKIRDGIIKDAMTIAAVFRAKLLDLL